MNEAFHHQRAARLNIDVFKTALSTLKSDEIMKVCMYLAVAALVNKSSRGRLI